MLRRSHLKVTSDQWVTKVLKQWPICVLCHRIAFIAHIVLGRRDLFWFYWESEKIIVTLVDGRGGPVILVKIFLIGTFWPDVSDYCECLWPHLLECSECLRQSDILFSGPDQFSTELPHLVFVTIIIECNWGELWQWVRVQLVEPAGLWKNFPEVRNRKGTESSLGSTGKTFATHVVTWVILELVDLANISHHTKLSHVA